MAAKRANPAAMKKLLLNDCDCSARVPAMAGPAIWPRAKIKVIMPKIRAVFAGPAKSPTKAAIMDGTLQATIP